MLLENFKDLKINNIVSLYDYDNQKYRVIDIVEKTGGVTVKRCYGHLDIPHLNTKPINIFFTQIEKIIK